MTEAVPETEAQSPVEVRKAMLTCGSEERSSVLPDWLFVWKMRSRPSASCWWVRWGLVGGRGG